MLVLLAFAPILLNAFGGGGLLSSLVIAGIFLSRCSGSTC
jgi:hypothetical protein